MLKVVKYLSKKEEKKTKKAIGYTLVDLDARESKIRREESEIANFLADLTNYLA